jgi:hypothetical protein
VDTDGEYNIIIASKWNPIYEKLRCFTEPFPKVHQNCSQWERRSHACVPKRSCNILTMGTAFPPVHLEMTTELVTENVIFTPTNCPFAHCAYNHQTVIYRQANGSVNGLKVSTPMLSTVKLLGRKFRGNGGDGGEVLDGVGKRLGRTFDLHLNTRGMSHGFV